MALFGKVEQKTEKEIEELSKYNSHITKGTVFKGDIEAVGSVRVDGKLVGNIRSKSKVVVGEHAIVQGDIFAQQVEIEGGELQGRLEVSDTLTLRAKALVNGDIVTGKLIVESGAVFNGSCQMGVSANEINSLLSEVNIENAQE